MTDDPQERQRPYIAVGVLTRNGAGQVLMVEPTYKPYWDIPGGYVERGESPLEACRREVAEELGIELPIGRLLVADWAPHPEEGEKLLYIFDGGVIGSELEGSIKLQASELRSYSFVNVNQAPAITVARLARRLQEAYAELQSPSSAYREHGAMPNALS